MGGVCSRRESRYELPAGQPLTLHLSGLGAEESVSLQIAGDATVDQLVAEARERLHCTIDIDILLVYGGTVLVQGLDSLAALGIKHGAHMTVMKQDAKPLVKNNAEFGLIVSRTLAAASHPLTREASISLVRNSLYAPIAIDSIYRQDPYTEFDLHVLTKESFPGLGDAKKINLQNLQMQGLLEDRGHFGSVALFGDSGIDGGVTVKLCNKVNYQKQRIVARLINERICFVLGRPSSFVATFYCALNLQKNIAFCLEPLLGGNLATIYKNRDFFGNVSVSRFCCASASLALEHLHCVRVAVRQVVPESLTFDHRGYLKLTDLGCAKIIVTRTYTLCGTAGYMPPEHILNKGHTCAVDPWNLGVLLFELLSRKTPFEGPDEFGDHYLMMQKTLRGIDAVDFPDSIGDAESLVKALLRSNPWERLSMGSGGWCDFRAHEYFASFDFEALRRGDMASPYVPNVDWRSNLVNSEEHETEQEEPATIFEEHFGAVL